jgi:group II intron reverse transcriptase/maturase
MRRAGESQLSLVFGDTPHGSEPAPPLEGKVWLRCIAGNKEATDPAATSVDTSRLLERVASARNLAQALLGVASNQGAAGVDGRSVGEVVGAARRLLPKLRTELLLGRYRPGDVRRVWIAKPGGGQRGLGIPNVVDRWVQEAVRQVLEPIFEPTFHDSSHGFRKGRGAQTALAQAQGYLEQGYAVAVDLDIASFFDRVHHQRLLARLARQVADARLLLLIGRMLKAKVVLPDGTRVTTREGTPQGGPLSPLLSNVVLDELDWELQRRGLRFVRYADDSLIFVRSRRAAERVMAATSRFLLRRLRLEVNAEKSVILRQGSIRFLGFRLGSNRAGQVAVHLSQRSYDRLLLRIRELTPRNWGQSVASAIEGCNEYLRGWMGHFQLCTEEGARILPRFDAHIRRRLRAIILRHKKRRRYLFRHLIERGVPRDFAAASAFGSRGYWYRSNSRGICSAYPNAWFARRLVSLADEWQRLNRPGPVSGQGLLFA